MISKKPAPALSRGGYRFSDKDHASPKSQRDDASTKRHPASGARCVSAPPWSKAVRAGVRRIATKQRGPGAIAQILGSGPACPLLEDGLALLRGPFDRILGARLTGRRLCHH